MHWLCSTVSMMQAQHAQCYFLALFVPFMQAFTMSAKGATTSSPSNADSAEFERLCSEEKLCGKS